MTDRNWEAELAKIDKQLASISDDKLLADSKPVPAGKGTAPAALAAPKSAPPAQYSFGMSLGKTDPLTQEIFERLMRTFPSRDNGGASPDQDEE